jgi:hypothetical protein
MGCGCGGGSNVKKVTPIKRKVILIVKMLQELQVMSDVVHNQLAEE